MNRADRRALARQLGRRPVSLPPLCPSGSHAFAELAGTYRGEVVARRVVCSSCRRTFEQVLEQQPEEAARFLEWLRTQPEGQAR